MHKQRIGGVRTVLPGDLLGLRSGGTLSDQKSSHCGEDGVHLTAEGYTILAKAINRIVCSQLALPGSAPRASRRHFGELPDMDDGEGEVTSDPKRRVILR